MRKYLFFDERRADTYLQQIPRMTRLRLRPSVGVSLAGLKLDVAESTTSSAFEAHEKFELLIKGLKKKRLLAQERPARMLDPENDCPFALETMDAQKVVFPQATLAHAPGVRSLAVWVSDPTPEALDMSKSRDWDWTGTFLYLTETVLDGGGYQSVYSGCSALQAIANAVAGEKIINAPRMKNAWEPLGRGAYIHPLKKFIQAGAKAVGTPRRIVSLYEKRYITNEQCFELRGDNYQANDLLGYPIFIAEELSDGCQG